MESHLVQGMIASYFIGAGPNLPADGSKTAGTPLHFNASNYYNAPRQQLPQLTQKQFGFNAYAQPLRNIR